MPASTSPPARIAYLGPQGTFSEEALLSETDLAGCDLVAMGTIQEAIRAAAGGEVDAAFVPIENSIEGPVNATVDELVFGNELFIQREVTLEIHLDLLAVPGATLSGITQVVSYPHATAQCREFVTAMLPTATFGATNSTADAARLVAEGRSPDTAALAPPLAAKIYGLDVLAHAVEDHSGNETRFVLVARNSVPPPTSEDRTALVCFQHADRPGSLYEILGQFATRGVNLTRIESRPTKQALGDYCFVIEIEGHIADPVVADCLVELHGTLESIRFLGSYPVETSSESSARVEEVAQALTDSRTWVESLRRRIRSTDRFWPVV